jgi:hypothetical protein
MVRLRACYFFNINQRVWVKSWRYLHFRKIATVESVMSKINAVLSFLVNTPANNTPAIQEKKTMNTADTLALVTAYDKGQIRNLESEINRLRAQVAQLTYTNVQLAADVKQGEELQTVILRANDKSQRDLRNAEFQAQNLNTLANQNAAKANALAEEVEDAKAMTVIANNWLAESLRLGSRQARLTQAFRNIARSSKGRVSSKFALPAIETEVEAAELAYFDRISIDKAEDIAETLTPASRKLIGFGKDNVEGAYHCRSCRKVEAHRGHRNGHVPMSARETFHYLNR